MPFECPRWSYALWETYGLIRQLEPDDWMRLRDARLRALASDPGAFLVTLDEARKFPDERWRERAVQTGDGDVDGVEVLPHHQAPGSAVSASSNCRASQRALAALGRMPAWQGDLAGAFGITALSNVINNLPCGLITGTAIEQSPVSETLRNALLIGVDLGPNLSVTGSLATILWLIVLRREKQQVSAWSFLKVGVVVTPPALIHAVLASTFLKLKH